MTQKAMMDMPASAPAMRRHMGAEPPAGHGADMPEDMPMGTMAGKHDAMHADGAEHTHPKASHDVGYKAFTPTDLQLSESGEVLIAFSRLNVRDKDGDVTRPGAIPAGKAVPMSAYGHTSWDGALPVGKGILGESGDLGTFTGTFFMDTEQGRNAHATVKAMGDIQEWSYGYDILDGGPATFNGTNVRELRKLDIHEVSPVLRGAGVGTATLAIKSGAPGSDAPYAEQLSWYSDGLPALLDRVKSRVDIRAAEGRKLSRTDRARLEDLAAALEGHLAAVHDLLIVPEDPKAAERRLQAVMVEVETARMLGVPV